MQKISKGIIGVTRKGEIIVFENGNDGKDGEYQTYTEKHLKQFRFLFATPSDLAHALKEGSDDSEKIRTLKAHLDGFGYDIEEIRNIVNG
jgi:hypothetical protein